MFDIFKNLTPTLWVSQILGILAFLLLTFAYQLDKNKFLIVSFFTYILFMFESLLAKAYPTVFTNLVALIRNFVIIYYLFEYNKKMPQILMFGFVLLLVLINVLYLIKSDNYMVWYMYIPVVGTAIYSISINSKSYLKLQIGALILEASLIIYYFMYGLPFSLLRQVILTMSISIAIIKFFINKNKAKVN